MKRTIAITTVIFLLLPSVVWAQETSTDTSLLMKNSFGLGFGIPYGVLGVNADINAAPNLNLSAGVGTTVFAGIGYNVGLKYFFTPIENTFRPRVSAYYGINSMVLKEYGYKEDEGEAYTGLSIGIGAQWMWGEDKSKGLDFDIIYIATTGYDIDELKKEGFIVEEYGRVKISIGYRHAF